MNQPVVRKDKPIKGASIFQWVFHPYFSGALIGIVTFGLIFLLMLSAISPKRYELKEGDIPAEPIAATRDVEDVSATKEKVQLAKDKVPETYSLDQTITTAVVQKMNDVFKGMEDVREAAKDKLKAWEDHQQELLRQWEEAQRQQEQQQGESSDPGAGGQPDTSEQVDTTTEPSTPEEIVLPPEIQTEPDFKELYNDEFIKEAQKLLPIQFSKDDIMTVITADQRELNLLKQRLTSAMSDMLEMGIKEEQLSESKINLRDSIQGMTISNELKLLGINLGVPHLEANMLYNPEKTLEEREKAAARVDKVIYKKGQYIVQAGQPVTEAQIDMLGELGLLKDNSVDGPMIAGIAITVFLSLALLVCYLMYFEKDILAKPHMLLLLSSILLLVLGTTYVTSFLNKYLIPAAMAGMLTAILINPVLGMLVNFITALLVGLMAGLYLPAAAITAAGGIVGICLLKTIQQRNSLVWAGMGVAATNILATGSFEMLSAGGWLGPIYSSLWGAMGGLLASVLTIGTLPIWENLFNVVTPIKLVELSNPNQPILKRLLMETPGTYHHSIIVANLAESAADAIGANGLLARVGAYYHDIGKLERPYYFKENQLYADNPHDRLDPALSTRIITSHTTDGIELAKRYKVPKIIHDFITQHHGTTPVVYFYHKAKNNTDKDIKLEEFRYAGPKPTSRETAILMMADTAEAAVRALSDHTPEKVEELIKKLIREKQEDGQFDDSGLTLGDLNTIAKAFTNVISGIFHERVKYPEVNLNEER